MTQAANWQKSSFSGGGDGNTCVELTSLNGEARLRESDEPGTELSTTPTRLATFIAAVKAGGFTEPAARS